MKKATLISLLSFVLIFAVFSPTAFAAPTRDLSREAMKNEELITQIQPLADAVAYVAFSRDLTALEPDTAPDAALVEGLLYRAFSEHLLVAPADENGVALSLDAALKAADSLFSWKDLPELEGTTLPDLTLRDGEVVMDLSRNTDFIGTHVYDIVLDEEKLLIKTDVYRLSGIVASAVEAPEDSLVWLGAMTAELKPETDAAVGFSLSGFQVQERYQPTSFLQFTKKDRFELLYPDLFSKAVQDMGAFLSLETEDGSASLKVTEVSGTFEELLAAWQGEADEYARIDTENGRAIFTAPGLVKLAYADTQDGRDVCLVLEMNYPREREMEFTLYRTFLDNSFVVYSHSMG